LVFSLTDWGSYTLRSVFLPKIKETRHWDNPPNSSRVGFLDRRNKRLVIVRVQLCLNIQGVTLPKYRFYKEELAGETATYIHNRAKVEGKTPMDVFGQLRFELAEAAKSIDAVVGGSTANIIEAWSEYEFGYMCVFSLL